MERNPHNDYEKSILAKLIVDEISKRTGNITDKSDIEDVILNTTSRQSYQILSSSC